MRISPAQVLSLLLIVVTGIAVGVAGCNKKSAKNIYSECEPVRGPTVLRALPASFRDDWVDRNDGRTFDGIVVRSDCKPLGELSVASGVDWAAPMIEPTFDPAIAAFVISVDVTGLVSGIDASTTIDVSSAGPDVGAVSIRVQVRVLDFQLIRVGPQGSVCPHVLDDGSIDPKCDFVGAYGLITAAKSKSGAALRILVYDNAGQRFIYKGPVELPDDTWLSTVPGVRRDNVWIRSWGSNPPIMLNGNRIRVENISLGLFANAQTSFMASPGWDQAQLATRGHLIENVVAFAGQPGRMSANGINGVFFIGPETTVRNSHFYGYFDTSLRLEAADNSRIVGNTFVYYQRFKGIWDTAGSENLIIANNVILSPVDRSTHWLTGSPETSGLVVVDNLFEGVDAVHDGAIGANHRVEGNVLAEGELDSPRAPRFLSDSSQQTRGHWPGEGVSMDGVPLAGRSGMWPGAYQLPADRSRPRLRTIRVGDVSCGSVPCDISIYEPNEIQLAVWSSWPGGTVEVYPSVRRYAGYANIPWGLTLRGMGEEPGAVTLVAIQEDSLLRQFSLWTTLRAVLVVHAGVTGQVRLENFSVSSDGSSGNLDQIIRFDDPYDPLYWRHEVRRLIVKTVLPIQRALFLGERVLVQDTYVMGAFGACAAFGSADGYGSAAPEPTTGWMVNVTCRLNGDVSTLDLTPTAAIEVAGVVDSVFANLIVDFDYADQAPEMALFSASVDPPTSFDARAISVRGHTWPLCGFSDTGGDFDITQLPLATLVFDNADDARLHVESDDIDNGLPYIDLGIEDLRPAISINGENRKGRNIDRGAYEQGN